ncbi:hypothetical protein [Nocardia tengchongensis]|uniref:hypothetical protein n=1 Tax=Nocardia tengchongensis TaxID=2055889 RepID=UPI0036BB1EFA
MVDQVYQVSANGTKAFVRLDGTPWARDSWFWHWHGLIPGSVYAVYSSQGWGPHTQRHDVLYIGSDDSGHGVMEVIDARTCAAAHRHLGRFTTTSR